MKKMINKYQLLEDLERVRKDGIISEEEYQKERNTILNMKDSPKNNNKPFLGMKENTYIMLMHLSIFAGIIIFGLGLVAPLILWSLNKDNSPEVDRHGKNIFNLLISWTLYSLIIVFLNFTIIFIIIGLPLLLVAVILPFIFIIIAAINASNGIFWKYPLSIPFFSVKKNESTKQSDFQNQNRF